MSVGPNRDYLCMKHLKSTKLLVNQSYNINTQIDLHVWEKRHLLHLLSYCMLCTLLFLTL